MVFYIYYQILLAEDAKIQKIKQLKLNRISSWPAQLCNKLQPSGKVSELKTTTTKENRNCIFQQTMNIHNGYKMSKTACYTALDITLPQPECLQGMTQKNNKDRESTKGADGRGQPPWRPSFPIIRFITKQNMTLDHGI